MAEEQEKIIIIPDKNEEEDEEEIKKALDGLANTNTSTLERNIPESMKKSEIKGESGEKLDKLRDRYSNWEKHPLPGENGKLRYIPKECIIMETGLQTFIDGFRGRFSTKLKKLSGSKLKKEINSIIRRVSNGAYQVSKDNCGEPKEYRVVLKSDDFAVLSSYSNNEEIAEERFYSTVLKLFD